MTDRHKYLILSAFALLTCTVPSIVATVYFFPLWVSKGSETTVSGLSVLLLLLCIIPFVRTIKEALKSPDAKTVWFILLLLFWLIRTIVDEMVVICGVGFLSNVLGSLLYAWRNKYSEVKERDRNG